MCENLESFQKSNMAIQQGVIEESINPWTSPVILVKKKDGTIKFCVNYCKINAITIKDSYSLLKMIFSTNYWLLFSTLDLKSG